MQATQPIIDTEEFSNNTYFHQIISKFEAKQNMHVLHFTILLCIFIPHQLDLLNLK